jgi:hypothetical protein
MLIQVVKILGLSSALAACASAMPQPRAERVAAPRTAESLGQTEADLALRLRNRHNFHRSAVGVPQLEWDPALAASAEQYAAQLAADGQLVHSPRAGRPGQSENLWRGDRGAFAPERMVDYWAEERASFRPGIFPNVSTTGDWNDVAHYTVMIWRSTTHLGCGLARSRQSDYLVCRYSPAGNKDGKPVP